MTLDIHIARIALLAGHYCPLVALWESDLFVCAYEHWEIASAERDAWDADREHLANENASERLTPKPIRSAHVDAALRAAGWNW